MGNLNFCTFIKNSNGLTSWSFEIPASAYCHPLCAIRRSDENKLNSNKMKNKIIVYLMILFGLGTQTYSQTSEFEILKEKVLTGKDGEDYWVYCYNQNLSFSDTVKLWNRDLISPFKKSLLFLIDDHPFSDWTHSCRYIFYNTQNGEYHTIQETHPPKLFDKFRLLSEVTIPAGEKYDFSKYASKNKAGLKSAISPGDASYGYKYAIIISGGYNKYNNHERYWNHCQAIYNALRYNYDFEHHQVFVLMSDGGNTAADRHLISGGYDDSPRDLDGDGTTDVTNRAAKSAITELFDGLGEWMTPNDFLYVYVTDHGGLESGSNVNITLWDEEEMRDDELATELNKVNAKIMLTMVQCHSGGFIDDLAGANRIISTSCRADESARARPDLTYSEFVYHWTAGVFGEYPDGTNANADANSDGFVSMEEAHDFAEANDMYAHGSGASEHPQYSSTPATFGEQLTLFGFEINSNLQNITINSGEEQKHYAYNISVAGDGTNYTVKNGGKSYLKAGNSIVLEPGFSAELGSEFQAVIQPFTIPVFTATSSLKSAEVINSSSQVNLIEDSENIELNEVISVFPNPSTGLFYFLNKNDTELKINVYNSSGSLIITEKVTSNRWVIDISNQPSGVYFLKLFSNDKSTTKKLIKK